LQLPIPETPSAFHLREVSGCNYEIRLTAIFDPVRRDPRFEKLAGSDAPTDAKPESRLLYQIAAASVCGGIYLDRWGHFFPNSVFGGRDLLRDSITGGKRSGTEIQQKGKIHYDR
jgi:hypothetical protein